MNAEEKVYKVLDDLGIDYEVIHHPPVYTIDEMDALNIFGEGEVCKNLFLKDSKGKRHFIVTISKDKKVDLKSLKMQLNCSGLSFASEDRLNRYLKLQKGEVTPLGILNDVDASVEVAFDQDLVGRSKLGVHPNNNAITIWISYDDLKKVIENHGNKVSLVCI